MSTPAIYPRLVQPRLTEALADSPVVLIHGPRQCGKTTLARAVGDVAGYAYISFDDDVLRASARADPMGFVADLPDKAVLDEVQRVPQLFTALKTAVDRDRRPGRFILTGSANVLLLPKLADSLAGRMEILRLHPLAQVELEGKPADFLLLDAPSAFEALRLVPARLHVFKNGREVAYTLPGRSVVKRSGDEEGKEVTYLIG